MSPGVSPQHHAWRDTRIFCIHDGNVHALQVAADQDGAAAGVSGHIDARAHLKMHLLAQNFNMTTFRRRQRHRPLERRHLGRRRGGHRPCDMDASSVSGGANRTCRRAFSRVGRNDGTVADDHVTRCGRDRYRPTRLTWAAFGQHLRTGCDLDIPERPQHHLATFQGRGLGPDDAAVLQRSCEDTDRIALERAQVDRLIARRLDFQANPFQSAASDLDRLAGCEDGGAAAGLHHRSLAHLQPGPDQDDVAATRKNGSLDIQRADRAISAKPQPTGHGVGVAHSQRRCGEACGVDNRTHPHGDARGIHQNQPAVGTEGAEDCTRIRPGHAVDGSAGAARLGEPGGGAGRHAETLPVDRGVAAARAVLRRDRQARSVVGQRGAAMDCLRASRLGKSVDAETCSNRHGDRKRPVARNRRGSSRDATRRMLQ